MRIKIVANKCRWESWPQKITELANWFAPKFQIDIAIEHVSLDDIPFVDYDDGNPKTNNMRGVEPAWYDKNITWRGIGFDMVLFVMSKKDWKGFGSRGWRSDSDQGPVQLQLGCDEKQMERWPNFPAMDSFFQIARHEICHGLFMLSGQIDTTHFYWDMGKLELARDSVILPNNYSLPIIIRAFNFLMTLLNTTPTKPIEPDEPGEILYKTALSYLGTDASPSDIAPDELGCAESVNCVHKKAFGKEIGGDVSTYRLYGALKAHPLFKKVDVPARGDIIISPTGFGKGSIPNGHTGIVGEAGTIMSNESRSGKFEKNFTIETWRARYEKLGKYPVHFFRRM